MKIICVTGAPGSDVNKVADIFFAAGIKAAQPLRQDASFTLASWHEKVIAAAGSSDALPGPVRQPGRFWEQFATNLFMENMQQPQWGWADSRSVWLLDFWQEFEPNLHFVLVYTSPQRALAQALAAEREHGSDTATLMAAWEAHQKEILRFHHRNPTRTILVDAAASAAAPAALLDICAVRWKLDLAPVAITLSATSVAAPLVSYLAEQLRQTQPELQALQQELEASLQVRLPESDDSSLTTELFTAVEDYKQLRSAAMRADAFALQIDAMTSQFALTEKKLKAEQAETRSESEQVLLQLHQLQEEMERGFLRNKELEEIKAKKKRTIDELTQKLAQAEATTTTLKKDLENAKANKSAEKDKADALATLATTKKDLDAARQDIKRLYGEHDAAKEAFKRELEAAKANRTAEKEKADALAALTTAKKDLDAARQDNKRLTDEQTATKQTQQENELLLIQLHQVQEELEHYFLQHKNVVKQNQELNVRWDRMLARTPDYCDYDSLELLGSDQAGERACWQFTNLNANGRAYTELRFDTVITDGIAGFAFAHGNKLPNTPEAFEALTTSEWLLLPTLCRILDEALHTPTGSVMQLGQMERTALIDALAGLTNVINAVPDTPRFDQITLKREQVNPDYEHLWLQLGNLSMGEKRWADIDFRLSCANIRPGNFGAHPKLEFPSETGSSLLEGWFAESFDDFGDKLELRFALPESMDLSVWEKLTEVDQTIVKMLADNLSLMISRLSDSQVILTRSLAEWQELAESIQSILATRTVAGIPPSTRAAVPDMPALLQTNNLLDVGMIQKGFI